MADEDFVLARYLHPNRGRHRVIGTETRTDYGYRKGGDTFLVHRRDLATQPHLFMAVERPAAAQAPRPSAPLPPPAAMPTAVPAPRPPSDGQGVPEAFDLQKLPGVTKQIAASLREAGIDTPDAILEAGVGRLVELKWIGESRAEMIVRSVLMLKAMAAEVEPA